MLVCFFEAVFEADLSMGLWRPPKECTHKCSQPSMLLLCRNRFLTGQTGFINFSHCKNQPTNLFQPVLFLNTTLQNSTGKLGLLYCTNDVMCKSGLTIWTRKCFTFMNWFNMQPKAVFLCKPRITIWTWKFHTSVNGAYVSVKATFNRCFIFTFLTMIHLHVLIFTSCQINNNQYIHIQSCLRCTKMELFISTFNPCSHICCVNLAYRPGLGIDLCAGGCVCVERGRGSH